MPESRASRKGIGEARAETAAAQEARVEKAIDAVYKAILDIVYTPDGKALPRDEVEHRLRERRLHKRGFPAGC